MNNIQRINKKLKQSGIPGLTIGALRYALNILEGNIKNKINSIPRQSIPHKLLSRYTSFEGKTILEIGGLQSCESAYPFLKHGAASVIVSGLDHISQEKVSEKFNLSIMRADGHKLSDVFEPCRFDIVYGLSVIEHIPSPDVFLDQVYAVLKPGGLAFFQGNPVWSSPKGHHLWIATWGGAYQNKATTNYLFNNESTNPIPDWSHLLMSPDQLRENLIKKSIPDQDISCIIDWVFSSVEINRLNMNQIAEAYTSSKLIVLEATVDRVDVPVNILESLRERFGNGIDYGISGVSYVLVKPG